MVSICSKKERERERFRFNAINDSIMKSGKKQSGPEWEAVAASSSDHTRASSTVTERMDGQIFPHSRGACEYKALRSFKQLLPTIFIISLVLSIFL